MKVVFIQKLVPFGMTKEKAKNIKMSASKFSGQIKIERDHGMLVAWVPKGCDFFQSSAKLADVYQQIRDEYPLAVIRFGVGISRREQQEFVAA